MGKIKHSNYRLIIEHDSEPITDAEDKKINKVLIRIYDFCLEKEKNK